MKCNKCKNKINKGENFCSMCGSEVVRASNNAKSKKIIALVCCVAIILSGTISGLFFYNKKSKSTLDIDGNYNCFTEGFTDVITVELDNTESTENTTTTISNETTNADIPEAEAIAAFERMLKDSDAIWGWNVYEGYDNHQFASMSNSEIIENWIACDGTPLGVYEVFSPDGTNGIKYTDEPSEENSYSDPEGKFWCSYELDADLVDWILKNVFGKEPDRNLSSDNTYYSGNKVYVHSELGGGPGYIYKISDYEKLSDGKYFIYVDAEYEVDAGVPDTYLKFTATPKRDTEKGIYWQIHSLEGRKNKIPETTTILSPEINESADAPIDVSKYYDLTFYEFAEKFNMTVSEGPGGCNAHGTSENLYRRGEYASFYSISLHSSLEDKNTKGAFQTSIISEKYSFYGVQIGMDFAECTSILKKRGFTLDESKTWNVDNSYFYYFYNSQGDQIQLNIYDDNCDGIDFYPNI